MGIIEPTSLSSSSSTTTTTTTTTPPTIPIVDFANWTAAHSTLAHKQEIGRRLIAACQSVGFVYITNHQIPPARVAEAFAWARKLFALGRDEKMRAPHPAGSAVHRGYSWPGLEKVSNLMGDGSDADGAAAARNARLVEDVKESYEIGSEDNSDQPNVWLPETILPGFRAFTTAFYWESHANAQMILRAMALGLGLPSEDFFLRFHSGHNNQLRLLHYPAVPTARLESEVFTRLDAHTDWPSITMVFQDDCGGLQIENPHKAGDFMDAPPLRDAIVMNIGDLMQRWTNDTLKSTLHRVGLPPPADLDSSHYDNNNNSHDNNNNNSSSSSNGDNNNNNNKNTTNDDKGSDDVNGMTRERYSIPYFVSPEGPTVVECLDTCVSEARPRRHEPIVWNDYMRMRAAMQYE